MKFRFLLIAAIGIAATAWTYTWVTGTQVSAQTTTAAAQASSAPWQWPAIPGCLADPGTSTGGKTDYNSPICTLYDQLLAGGASGVKLKSARRLNAEMDGVLYPAFLPGTEVVSFLVTEKFSQSFTLLNPLVRASGSPDGAAKGSWWTTFSTVSAGGQLLDSDAIRSRLALLSSPTCLSFADSVRTGVRAYMGVVAPAFNEPGGGVEFWFPPDSVEATRFANVPGTKGCGK